MSFVSEFKDRLEKIPPWGYAAIAGGVLLLAVLSSRKGGGVEEETAGRTIYSVDAGAETYVNDLQWRLEDRIDNLMDKMYEGDEGLMDELDKMKDAIDGLGDAPKPVTPTTPKPAAPKPAAPKPSAPKPAPPKAKPKSSNPSWWSALTRKSYSTPRGGWDRNSVVDQMKSMGYDASFAERKQLAGAMGIKNYTGTASQNTTLLSRLKSKK